MSSSMERLLLIPEFVEQIILALNNLQLLNPSSQERQRAYCTQVSTSWRQVFTPFYWSSVEDTLESRQGRTFQKLWPRVRRDTILCIEKRGEPQSFMVPAQAEESHQIRRYLQPFLRQVRHLSIRYPWTLDLFLNSNDDDNDNDKSPSSSFSSSPSSSLGTTELVTLSVGISWQAVDNFVDRAKPLTLGKTRMVAFTDDTSTTGLSFTITPGKPFFQDDEDEVKDEETESPTWQEQDLCDQQQQQQAHRNHRRWHIPRDALEDTCDNGTCYPDQRSVSRAHWQLILRSPKLKSLVFGHSTNVRLWTLALKNPTTTSSSNSTLTQPSPSLPSSSLQLPTTHSVGARFLVQVLQRLKNLDHFELRLFSKEDLVLEIMAQQHALGHCTIRSFKTQEPFLIPKSSPLYHKQLVERLYNPGVRIVDLGPTTTRQFRFFLKVFPNLTKLTLSSIAIRLHAIERGIPTTEEEMDQEMAQPLLIHPSLESLHIRGPAPGLGVSRVRFDRLNEFKAMELNLEIRDLERLLRWIMPNCRIVQVGVNDRWKVIYTSYPSSITSTTAAPAAALFSEQRQDLTVREMIYKFKRWRPIPEVEACFQLMPCLTKVEFQQQIPSKLVETLARSCSKLQDLKIRGIVGKGSREFSILLGSCPDLQTVSGPGLVLKAIDVIRWQPWVCLGLKQLQCRIASVPRLTCQEENDLSELDDGSEIKTFEDVTLALEQEHAGWDRDLWNNGDEEMKLRGQRIETLGRQKHLLTLRARSRELQQQVFAQLGRLQELRILDLGDHRSDSNMDRTGRERPYSLEWSFESGVRHLERLTKLKVLYVHKFEHRIREDQELVWIKDTWPRLTSGPIPREPRYTL